MVRDAQWNRQRESGKKILAVFVWQQKAEEPQGHTNERKAFQQWGKSPARVGSSHGCQTSEMAGGSAGEGSLRGQGSELSGDPTTTNAALVFKLFHRQLCKTAGEPASSL